MSKTNGKLNAAERELTEDDLALVSGGEWKGKYMEVKLKEVSISSVMPSS